MLAFFVLKPQGSQKNGWQDHFTCPKMQASSELLQPRSQNEGTCDIFKREIEFCFQHSLRKKSVKIKSLVEQGAIPFDIFGYYSLSTFPVFIFTLPTSSNISHCLLSNKFERCWNQISELPQASFLKVMFNTRDDSQRQFFAQHSVTMLEQCCNHSKQLS